MCMVGYLDLTPDLCLLIVDVFQLIMIARHIFQIKCHILLKGSFPSFIICYATQLKMGSFVRAKSSIHIAGHVYRC